MPPNLCPQLPGRLGVLEQPWAGRTLPMSLGSAGPFLPVGLSITLRRRVPPTAQPLYSSALPPPLNSPPSPVGS